MDVKVDKSGTIYTTVVVTLPPEQVDVAYQKALDAVRAELSLKGFRPGKVPQSLVVQRCHAQISAEAQQKLVEASVWQALAANDLQAIAPPQVLHGPFGRGEPFAYTVLVEKLPEFAAVQYEGLAIPAVDTDVADAEVQAHLQDLRRQAAQTAPVVGRNIAQRGDFVLVDYIGRLRHGLRPVGRENNILVELVPNRYLPGFTEAIEGALVPGQKDVELSFPTDFQAPLAGQAVRYSMTLKELKRLELPELDDEFAKDMGAESLAELTHQSKVSLTQAKVEKAQAQQKQALIESVLQLNPFEPPPSIVEAEIDGWIQSASARRKEQRQAAFDAAELADMRGRWHKTAETQVRWSILAQHVAKEENLVVDAAAIDAEIHRLCAQPGASVKEIAQHYQQKTHRMDLEARLIGEQVIAFLFQRAHAVAPAEPTQPDAPKDV